MKNTKKKTKQQIQKDKKETAEGDPSNVNTQPSVDLVDILFLMYFKD